ncbi:MAG: NHL repeat-containing protein [Candidatus Sericytochromatia bacterium]|nr:NHL repeat-containing protein [Candidatus Sericytochromatia bacterium]
MTSHIERIALSLTASLLSACIASQVGPRPDLTTSKVAAAKPPKAGGLIGLDGATLRTVTGAVRVPASLKPTAGVSLISERTAGIISERSAGIISDRGDRPTAVQARSAMGRLAPGDAGAERISAPEKFPRRLFQAPNLEERLVAGARVYLADAAGQRILGLPEAVTNAKGEFTIAKVPPDYTFVVVAEIPTESGRTAALQTIVRPTAMVVASNIEAASTLVAAGVLRGIAGQDLGAFNPADFRTAVETTRDNLRPEDIPDLTDRRAVLRRISELVSRIEGLEDSLADMRNELRSVQKSLDELKNDLSQRPAQPAGSPTPPPAAQSVSRDAPVATAPIDAKNSDVPGGEQSAAGQVPVATGAITLPKPVTSTEPTPRPTPAATTTPAAPVLWKAPLGKVTTLAGSAPGTAVGPAQTARFFSPEGIALGPDGNLYVTDTNNRRICRISPEGQVSVWAGGTLGSVDGPRLSASFVTPSRLAFGPDGSLYVTDTNACRIRKISPDGMVSTLAGSNAGFADGPGLIAKFDAPVGLSVAPDGTVFVADSLNNRIRKISPQGIVSTLAGSQEGYLDGPGTMAQFYSPFDLVWRPDGGLIVADTYNDRLRAIAPDGTVTSLTRGEMGLRDGPIAQAQFALPNGLALAPDGSLYISDVGNDRIRVISADGLVSTLAGSLMGFADGQGSAARFNTPSGLALGPDGSLYVVDLDNHRIRLIR